MANRHCMKHLSRRESDEGDGDGSGGVVGWWREDVAQEAVVETSSPTYVRAGYRYLISTSAPNHQKHKIQRTGQVSRLTRCVELVPATARRYPSSFLMNVQSVSAGSFADSEVPFGRSRE